MSNNVYAQVPGMPGYQPPQAVAPQPVPGPHQPPAIPGAAPPAQAYPQPAPVGLPTAGVPPVQAYPQPGYTPPQALAAPMPVQYGAPPVQAPPAQAYPQPAYNPGGPPSVAQYGQGGYDLSSDDLGDSRLPFLPVGDHTLRVIKTELVGKQRNAMAVELLCLTGEHAGQSFRRTYAFKGLDWQVERAEKEWNSFAVRAAGFETVADLKAAGSSTIAIYNACKQSPGCLAGKVVNVRVFDTGKRTQPKIAIDQATGQQRVLNPGGRVITGEQWGVYRGQ